MFKNLRLRIAIVCSAWRQLNISKHTSTVSCDLVLKMFLNVLLMTCIRNAFFVGLLLFISRMTFVNFAFVRVFDN